MTSKQKGQYEYGVWKMNIKSELYNYNVKLCKAHIIKGKHANTMRNYEKKFICKNCKYEAIHVRIWKLEWLNCDWNGQCEKGVWTLNIYLYNESQKGTSHQGYAKSI